MNLFDLFAKLTLDTSEYDSKLKEAENGAHGFASVLKKGIGTAAKTVVAGIGAAATGVSVLLKDSVQQFADYEQLIGGVETLFQNSANLIQQYAENAYKTSGLSANQYMETVTSFSASLLQSLGGDTEKAAQYADMAITDMSDNANKMGSDMSSIQAAYQGFAKQNYTMLDNLKLGYGGTKTEMERLILDAEKLDDSFKATRDANGDLAMSYSDIVDAIHIVQTEMGITGTTAKESSETISGSFASLKSAWSNLIAGLARDDADLDSLISNVVETAETAFNNLEPVFERALTGISSGVEKIVPIIAEKLPGIASKILPSITSTAAKTISAFANGISRNLKSLTKTALQIVKTLSDSIIKNLPGIAKAGLGIIVELTQGIAENLPELSSTIIDVISEIAGILTDPANLGVLIDAGISIVTGLADSIIEALPVLIERLPEILSNLVTAIVENAPKLLEAGVSLMMALVEGLIEAVPMLIEAIPAMIETLKNGFVQYWENIKETGRQLLERIKEGFMERFGDFSAAVSEFVSGIVEWFEGIPQWFAELPEKIAYELGVVVGTLAQWGADAYSWAQENVPQIVDSISTFFQELPGKINGFLDEAKQRFFEFASNMIATAQEKIPQLISTITSFFEELPGKLLEIGKNIVTGLWDGIVGAWDWLVGNVSSLIGSFVQGIKDTLGIASPSKVFASIGENMALGLDKGFDEAFGKVYDNITDSVGSLAGGDYSTDYTVAAPAQQASDGANWDTVAQLLMEIRDKIGGDVVLDSGQLVGYMDNALGAMSRRKARAYT